MQSVTEAPVLSLHCGICRAAIRSSGWVTHDGVRVHPSCWLKTGERPDIVRGAGKYAAGGEYGGAA